MLTKSGLGFLVVILILSSGFSRADTDNFRTFQDPNFGFSFQLPDSWQFSVNENKDYVFHGADNSPAGEATIVVQILTKQGNEGASDRSILEEFWESLSEVPAAGLEGDGMVPFAGSESPYFIAHYQAVTSSGEAAGFKHLQVIVDHGEYFFPLSFSAPIPVYEEYLKVFQHMIATFSFRG